MLWDGINAVDVLLDLVENEHHGVNPSKECPNSSAESLECTEGDFFGIFDRFLQGA